MVVRCLETNLTVNTRETKEIIMDFKRNSTDLAPLSINGTCLERVHTFQFLGVLITGN